MPWTSHKPLYCSDSRFGALLRPPCWSPSPSRSAPIYALGIFLHFLIAFSVTDIYYAASRRLRFLTEHPLVCGLVYGAIVENVMNLIVLPVSALHARGPYSLRDLLLGLGVHMVVIGLPVSFSVRRFGK